jgi:acetyl-CoA C-acetyltransferase
MEKGLEEKVIEDSQETTIKTEKEEKKKKIEAPKILKKEEKAGAKPIARVVASAAAGVPPNIMGIGPVAASKKALARAGLTINDMDIIEINEAFATQVLACLKGLGVAFDDKRVNPNGGAIAVGHPLGASGTRLALTAARQLQRSGGRYALVSLCIGGGQGMAAILERV